MKDGNTLQFLYLTFNTWYHLHINMGTINSTRFALRYSNRLELRIFGDKGAVKIEFDDALTEGNKFMFTDYIGREFSSKEDKLRWKTIETPP